MNQVLLRAEISFGGLNRSMPEKQLDLFQLPAGGPAQLGAGATTVMRRDAWRFASPSISACIQTPAACAFGRRICQITFSLVLSREIVSSRFTGRNTKPPVRLAAEVHPSMATLVHVGMGTVRTRLFLPTRSTR
jgi:hypothetical protein